MKVTAEERKANRGQGIREKASEREAKRFASLATLMSTVGRNHLPRRVQAGHIHASRNFPRGQSCSSPSIRRSKHFQTCRCCILIRGSMNVWSRTRIWSNSYGKLSSASCCRLSIVLC